MFAFARRRYEEAREGLASSILRDGPEPGADLADLDGWTIVDRATAS
jgi:hypothetical protein